MDDSPAAGGPGDGPAAGGPGDGPAAGGTITIEINGRRFDAPKQTMNGAEIKRLGDCPSDYMLIRVTSSDGDDVQVPDDELICLDSTMRFRIVNSSTFG